ncbi:hypothetical protein S1OALGB6SA_595 [Olavius algarvensis spirochete endosymbiont]|nr:MAG: hypothetical protein [Olavius algarvensis spirochete endosymbiont]VDA99526.1 hypothetical protein S1OALGB6SA_595 [Olavius algarvensis spirochete endosymbiont]
MIRIDYTEKYLVGEPGPNFYWMGNQYDYISILA